MRSFETAFDAKFLQHYQRGVKAYEYKGLRCLKSPIDMAIYLRVLWAERPKSIIEIGSKDGGSAALFADVQSMMALGAEVVSIDILPPTGLGLDGVRFLSGDVLDLGSVFSENHLYDLPRPWLVIEDSAHSYEGCTAALNFFDEHLRPGELLIMEDGVLDQLGQSQTYGGGPNKAIAEFFAADPDRFTVDEGLCDMFGRNATYNPNGYLRKL